MQEWKELEGHKSNLEEAHIRWNGHSLKTAACWTPLTLAPFGLARTPYQSTFPPINVLPTFAEKQIGRVMLGTWAWPKARPLPHNFFHRLVICSLFYSTCFAFGFALKQNCVLSRKAVLMVLSRLSGLPSGSSEVIIIAFSWIPPAIVAYVVREREAVEKIMKWPHFSMKTCHLDTNFPSPSSQAHHNSKHQQLTLGEKGLLKRYQTFKLNHFFLYLH